MNFSFEPHSEAKLPIDSISLSIMAELGGYVGGWGGEDGGGRENSVWHAKNWGGGNRSAVMTAAHNSELIDSVQTVNRLHWTKVGVRGDVSTFILPTHAHTHTLTHT